MTLRPIGFVIACMLSPAVLAGEAMPAAQQNALVQKYCAVCHTDSARSGGLTLEHFDAAQAAPSLAAMMLSKLTSGVLLETVRKAASDPDAAALVSRKMRTGAMGAAGIPIPDKATIAALMKALAVQATGASEWDVRRMEDPATKAQVLTASILRELPAKSAGEAEAYRLILACDPKTQHGEMQLAWAPAATLGALSATLDGKTSLRYKVEDGGGAAAAVSLAGPNMTLPAHTLGIKNLFPNESVEFSFDTLDASTRQSLAACFDNRS